MSDIRCRRIYDPVLPDDGFRVLVDRLWPRGISKTSSALDLWAKDISPSRELRTWFAHDAERYPEFRERYFAELDDAPAAAEFAALCGSKLEAGHVTFLYAAKDDGHNNALILREWVKRCIRCR